MNTESRNCQNCKFEFSIEPQDFEFYERMGVLAPTFCPTCRFQRRLMFRNERTLYQRECGLCNEKVITVYAPENPRVMYCNKCWWSDNWDPSEYATEYDPSRNFFEQFDELQKKVPFPALVVDAPTMVNSDYNNHAGHLKNCYWCFDADLCENTAYCRTAVQVKDSLDSTNLGGAESCCGIVMSSGFRVFYSYIVTQGVDVWFSRGCVGCSDCFGCVNLKNKKFHIFNKEYTEEEYRRKIAEYRLDTHEGLQKAKKDALEFWKTIPDRMSHMGVQSVNCTGDYVYLSKNTKDSYIAVSAEDSRYCQFISMPTTRDCYDYTEWGNNASNIYECVTVGEGASNVRFSWACWKANTMDIEYSMFCNSAQNLFGCVGMKKKQNCILNKEYSKEEFEKLREKIISDMNDRPYIDSAGRVFKYGEFFPYEIATYGYNESTARDFFPLNKEEVEKRGWFWRERSDTKHEPTMDATNVPSAIGDVTNDILKELISCAACKKAYRIIPMELELLRSMGIPAPRECPECRFKERMGWFNMPNLREASCECMGAESSNGAYKNTEEHDHGGEPCGKVEVVAYPEGDDGIKYCWRCFRSEFL